MWIRLGVEHHITYVKIHYFNNFPKDSLSCRERMSFISEIAVVAWL